MRYDDKKVSTDRDLLLSMRTSEEDKPQRMVNWVQVVTLSYENISLPAQIHSLGQFI